MTEQVDHQARMSHGASFLGVSSQEETLMMTQDLLKELQRTALPVFPEELEEIL